MQCCYGAAVAAVQASFWALFPGHLELAARRPSPARPGPIATQGLLPVSEPSSTPGPLAHPQAAGERREPWQSVCSTSSHTQPVHTLTAHTRSHTRHSVKVKLQELPSQWKVGCSAELRLQDAPGLRGAAKPGAGPQRPWRGASSSLAALLKERGGEGLFGPKGQTEPSSGALARAASGPCWASSTHHGGCRAHPGPRVCLAGLSPAMKWLSPPAAQAGVQEGPGGQPPWPEPRPPPSRRQLTSRRR